MEVRVLGEGLVRMRIDLAWLMEPLEVARAPVSNQVLHGIGYPSSDNLEYLFQNSPWSDAFCPILRYGLGITVERFP